VVSGTTTLNGLVGTQTNDNAAAGWVGELVQSNVLNSALVNLTNNVITNMTSISLTAGDWYLYGNAFFNASAAAGSLYQAQITSTSAAFADPSLQYYTSAGNAMPSNGGSVPGLRVSLAATTTYYMVVRSIFSSGTVGACGQLAARRVR